MSSTDRKWNPEVTSDPAYSVCLVCNGFTDGAHFGISACRACSAFFRRCVQLGNEFECRKGTRKCDVRKSVTRMCRGCRYEKCIRAGMLPDAISKSPPESTSSNFSPVSVPSSLPDLLAHVKTEMSENGSISECEAGPSSGDQTPPMFFLAAVADNYRILAQRRFESEQCIGPYADSRLLFATDKQIFARVTFEFLVQACEAATPIIKDFCSDSFEEFRNLDEETKMILLELFIPLIVHLEAYYNTAKNFRNEIGKRQITLTTFFDALGDLPSMEIMSKERILDPENVHLQKCFNRIDLDEIELVLMISILLWTPNLRSLSESMDELCIRMRQKCFHDLHYYYRHVQNKQAYATRLGEVMTLLEKLQETMRKKDEEYSLLFMFGVLDKNTSIYQIMKARRENRM